MRLLSAQRSLKNYLTRLTTTILLFIMHSTSNLCKNVLPFIQNAMFSTQKSLMKTVNLLQRNHFLKTYFCTLIFFIAVKVTQNTIGLESIRHIVTTLERNFGKIWLSSVPSIAMESFINVVEVQ